MIKCNQTVYQREMLGHSSLTLVTLVDMMFADNQLLLFSHLFLSCLEM